jgi:N-acetylneuraminic acid mutarotase
MKRAAFLFTLLLGGALLPAADAPKIANMPAAVSGNAVASLKGGLELFSIMGVGPRKTWDDVTNRVYIFNLASGKWREGRPVPGVAGRLGASAIGARGKIFLFGGYVLDGQGAELTVSDVSAYVPDDHKWYRGADIPLPVDRSVVGVNHDRFIYLIGGRSKNGLVNNVQIYDAEKNVWSEGTPFPGTPVFGHAGGLADEEIIVIDGAKKNTGPGAPYLASDECWIGKIDHKDPNKIEWSKLPPHPGLARFGSASGAESHKIHFSGGSASPHDFKGIGYDGQPADVSSVSFLYDLHANQWVTADENTVEPRMDCGGILATPAGLVILGGMTKGQTATALATLFARK